jgi:hypothetical protein
MGNAEILNREFLCHQIMAQVSILGDDSFFKIYQMKKFVVERNFPGAADLSLEELQTISQNYCEAIDKLAKPYHWMHSYITGDKIYCIHIAESEEVVREHAKLGKIPINTVSEVKTIIDPANSNPLS